MRRFNITIRSVSIVMALLLVGHTQCYGEIWTSSDDLSGTSGCAVARAQAVLIYGANHCHHGCVSGPRNAEDVNTSNPDVCTPGDPYGSAGGTRNGFAILSCEAGETRVDDECIAVTAGPGGGASGSSQGGYCPVGNPIDPLTGAKTEYKLDYTTIEQNPLKVERYYTSKTNTMIGSLRKSRFGYGWRSNFDVLARISTSEPTAKFYVVLPEGRQLTFLSQSNGVWVRGYYDAAASNWLNDPTSSVEKLTVVGSNYELTTSDNVTFSFDSKAKLIQIKYIGGYLQDISYDKFGFNSDVTDNKGRVIHFNYDLLGQVKSIDTPSGSIMYSYLDRLNSQFVQNHLPGDAYKTSEGVYEPVLQAVTYNNLPNENVSYHYEDNNNRFALTGLTDSRGVRYATFSYDSTGYAIETKHALNMSKYSLVYDLANKVTIVTNPLSRSTKYYYEFTAQGRIRLLSVQGQISANCPASLRSSSYDANGSVSSEMDEEGRKMTFIRDSSGRITSMTKGAP